MAAAANLKTTMSLDDKNFSAKLDSTIKKAQGSLKNMQGSVKGLGSVLGGLGGQMGGLIGNISGLSGAVSALANPFTAAGVAVGAAAVAFFNYNKHLEETQRLTKQFTGLDGNQLSSLTNGIQALADSTGKDFNDMLHAVEEHAKTFGISFEQALQNIQAGFVAGADENGTFLDSMKQYGPVFEDLGVKGDELAAILAQTRNGLFNDEGMAAIQMASKNLGNMSAKTKQDLAAVGVDADAMLQKVQNGEMSMFDMVKQIAGAMRDTGRNTQEYGAVLQDVFGKKGVALGSNFIDTVAEMSTNLQEVKGQTGEQGQVMDELINTTREWNNACESLFGATGLGFADMGKKMKIYILQNLTKIINKFIDLYNKADMFKGIIAALSRVNLNVWRVIAAIYREWGIAIKGISQAWEHLLNFEFDKVGSDISKLINDLGKNIKDTANDVINDFSGAYNTAANHKIHSVTTEADEAPSNDDRKPSKTPKETNGKSGKGSKTTPKKDVKDDKKDEPKFAAGSLEDLEDQRKKLIDSVNKGFYTKSKEEFLRELKDLDKKIENKKIEMGLILAPTDLQKLEKQLKELDDNQLTAELALPAEEYKKQRKEIEGNIKAEKIRIGVDLDADAVYEDYQELIANFNKKSSFEIAVGPNEITTKEDKLADIQQQMDANDSLLESLEKDKQKLEELKQAGTEAYQEIINKINETKEKQKELTGEAKNTSDGIKASNKLKENFNNAANAVGSLGDAFSSLGSSFESPELNIAGTVAQAIAQIALGFAQASSKEAKGGVWYWIAASVAGLATMASLIAQIHSLSGYAQGGIVGGGKQVGDKNLVRVNSGEIILNQGQQTRLWNMINGNTSFGDSNPGTRDVHFVLRGADLYGSINNYRRLTKK